MGVKKYSPDEIPQDGSCYDCRLSYSSDGWIEAVVPNDVWAIIAPTDHGGGVLCINCISRRCTEAGLWNVPVVFCGLEPLVPVAAFPSAVRCARCNDLGHIVTPDLSGLTTLGWRFDDTIHGWVCQKHSEDGDAICNS